MSIEHDGLQKDIQELRKAYALKDPRTPSGSLSHHARRGSNGVKACLWLEVHHVVKIAGTRPFAERPQLFAEGFLVGIAIGPDPTFGTIGVWMKYFATDRREHQPLICRQIELDLRPAARSRRDGAAVSNLALTVWTAPRVLVDIEFELIGGNAQS